MLALSVGFLDSNDVIVVQKLVEGLFFDLPAGFGHAFSGKETVGIPSREKEGGGIAREDAISVDLHVGVGRTGVSGWTGVGSARFTSKNSGWRASVGLQQRNGRRARNQGVSGDARVA